MSGSATRTSRLEQAGWYSVNAGSGGREVVVGEAVEDDRLIGYTTNRTEQSAVQQEQVLGGRRACGVIGRSSACREVRWTARAAGRTAGKVLGRHVGPTRKLFRKRVRLAQRRQGISWGDVRRQRRLNSVENDRVTSDSSALWHEVRVRGGSRRHNRRSVIFVRSESTEDGPRTPPGEEGRRRRCWRNRQWFGVSRRTALRAHGASRNLVSALTDNPSNTFEENPGLADRAGTTRVFVQTVLFELTSGSVRDGVNATAREEDQVRRVYGGRARCRRTPLTCRRHLPATLRGSRRGRAA